MDPYVLYPTSRSRDIGLLANDDIRGPEDEASLSVVFLHIFSS